MITIKKSIKESSIVNLSLFDHYSLEQRFAGVRAKQIKIATINLLYFPLCISGVKYSFYKPKLNRFKKNLNPLNHRFW